MDHELVNAIGTGDLLGVKLLVQGGASIAETVGRLSALSYAARLGRIPIIEWLLTEGGATISEVDGDGWTALLFAACRSGEEEPLQPVQWLLEHGGANITDVMPDGRTVWDLLERFLIADSGSQQDHDSVAVTALLRVMVLRQAPPADLTARLSPEHRLVVEEGARLRAGLPAYLVQRHALLNSHTSLIEPLRDLQLVADTHPHARKRKCKRKHAHSLA